MGDGKGEPKSNAEIIQRSSFRVPRFLRYFLQLCTDSSWIRFFRLASLSWPILKNALWLRAPRSPRTGRRGGRLWLMLIPLVLALAAEEFLPKLPTPVLRDLTIFLGSDAGQSFMSGNWGWLAVIVAMSVFNTVLGEELLFRGLLLPRMSGAFGRWDWVANGVLFAAYHLHVTWVIPQALLDTFIVAYPSRRYQSALIGIAVHSAQSVFFIAIAVALVLR